VSFIELLPEKIDAFVVVDPVGPDPLTAYRAYGRRLVLAVKRPPNIILSL
jgi:hypothetical protein